MNQILVKAKKAIWAAYRRNHSCPVSKDGYVCCPEDNLISSVHMADFKDDMDSGSGNELKGKFRALHSSAALAVNNFAVWKRNLTDLSLCGRLGFTSLIFERKCSTGLGGTPPNLDVFLESNFCVIAVESKFLEYLTPKRGHFSSSYNREKLPQAEDAWLHLIERIKKQPKQHLDMAQLVKHYLGLRNLSQESRIEIILLYLFWEPENWIDFDVFHQHRKEIAAFSSYIEKSSIRFIAQSYPELWTEWKNHHGDTDHICSLLSRYQLTI
ncbi:MAG: hypothetical protein JRE23_04215 [Deltaproteobacteria bacterium]|nr:hypothetical protein [Deltaproteobacteria bacterium]